MNHHNWLVSTAAFSSIEDTIDFCQEYSLDMEISKYARADYIDKMPDGDLQHLKELLESKNVKCLASHATSFSMNPAALDTKVVELTKFRFKQSLEIARVLGSKVLVFHSGYNSHIKLDSYRRQFVTKQVAFWKEFIEENKIDDLTIVLENTYEEDPLILKSVYEGVASEYFKACLDLGHIAVFSNYDVLHWLRILKNHLVHFHLHNNNTKRDQHKSVLRGVINFNEFFEEISRFNQPFSLTLEIFEKNDVIESLEFIRKNFTL